MPSHCTMPLELLQPGEWAEIEEVAGAPNWVCRLAELGFRVGTRFQMVCQGSPCLCRIDGSRLSLRSECGCRILVRPVAAAG